MIEYKVGSENHSSYWGKFYVKGLEKFEVKEGAEYDKHERYTEFAANAPSETVFTIFSQNGNKRGTQDFDFYICEVVPGEEKKITGGCYGKSAWCQGSFLVLAHGQGPIKAARLMNWWQKLAEKCGAHMADGKLKKGTKKKFATWCKSHLEIRGLKELPDLPADA